MASLHHTADGMTGAAGNLLQAADSNRSDADLTAVAARESSHNLATVAAAVDQMSSSAAEIAKRVAETASIAGSAVSQAQSADTAVRGLTEAVERIGAIAVAIGDVAAKTNLLALNATIEAARAGEAGRGFAVVAAEVKDLAGQTARATQEIGDQIRNVEAATGMAVQAVSSVSDAIRRVDAVAAAIAAGAEQQGVTTREIAASVGQVAGMTAQAAIRMAEMTDAAASARGQTADVERAAIRVTQQTGVLQQEVHFFLEAVRDGNGDHKRHERQAATGDVALTLNGQNSHGSLQDISLGGCNIATQLACDAGTELSLLLPGASEPVAARVAQNKNGTLSIFFRQDDATRRLVGAVIDRLVPALPTAA
jgi:methyl-accepting chemotaxis protein